MYRAYSNNVDEFRYDEVGHKFNNIKSINNTTEDILLSELPIENVEIDEIQNTKKYESSQKMDFVNDKKVFVDRLLSCHRHNLCKLLGLTLGLTMMTVSGLTLYILLSQISLMNNIFFFITSMSQIDLVRSSFSYPTILIAENYFAKTWLDDPTPFSYDFLSEFQTYAYNSLMIAYDSLAQSSEASKYYRYFYETNLTEYRISLGQIFTNNSTFYDLVDSVLAQSSRITHNVSIDLKADVYFYIIHNSINTILKFLSMILDDINYDNKAQSDITLNPTTINTFVIVICGSNLLIAVFLVISYLYAKTPLAPMEMFLYLSAEYCNNAHQSCEEFASICKLSTDKVEELDAHSKTIEIDELARLATDCNRHRHRRFYKGSLYLYGFSWKSAIALVAVMNVLYILSFTSYLTYMANIKDFATTFDSSNRSVFTFISSVVAYLYITK